MAANPLPPRPETVAPLRAALDRYAATAPAGDLFRDASDAVAQRWLTTADGLARTAHESGMSVPELVARQAQDLGLSFRMTGESDERPWPLSPMPLIIDADEWDQVERGLAQRAELLERLAADIYGEQAMVRCGHLPAAVVAGSRFFARKVAGRSQRGRNLLHVYAADLARGPGGQWRVLADRVRIATGIGYALENRLAFSRATGGLLSQINARRLARFFADLRAGIARDCTRESPRIALLTSGRFNQSYPEQAHLARYLGLPLVEGRDLAVDNGRLVVRTIAGPRRIDAAWRWIDTNMLDPMSFDSRSRIGVPGLFDAWRDGGTALVNWPGVEVLEAPALAAFLPRLCGALLGEDPILPNVATWWCGQRAEAATVRERFDTMLVRGAFGERVEGIDGAGPVPGAGFDPAAREALFAAMERRPMDYCGQEIVNLSTTPTLVDDRFAPRPFTVRAFLARDGAGQWQVMPGGFARLSSSDELLTTLMGAGDLSADVCVVDRRAAPEYGLTTMEAPAPVRRGGGILASQAADNLYWFGRYAERVEMTVRVLRSLLGASQEADSGVANTEYGAVLTGLLREWAALPEKPARIGPAEACRRVLIDAAEPGSIAALIAGLRRVGLTLRDRFAPDFWRIASRPAPRPASARPGALQETLQDLVERFGALSGLGAEDMVRGPAWRFLDMGRRIERAVAVCHLARQLAVTPAERGAVPTESLNALLDICDSQITYRSRYLTAPSRDAVLDLLLLDPDNPRAVVFQLGAIVDHIEALPRLADDQVPEPQLLAARAALAPFTSLPASSIDQKLLIATEDRLLDLSDAISARYFLRTEKEDSSRDRLLA